jgi:hypothetical protein
MSENTKSLTRAQEDRIRWLHEHGADDFPQAEVKSVRVTKATDAPDSAVAALAVVQVELGYPQDDKDYRKALRTRRTYLISPRGRMEHWDARRGFGATERTPRKKVARA